jgi:hypothetical protein
MSAFPDDADGAVLADLAAAGIDLSQPLEIEFPVAVPDEAAAEQTLAALTAAGYEGHIEFDEGEPDEDGELDPDDEEFGAAWTVYVYREMVPAYDAIMQMQSDLDRLAKPFGGQSDGWGVMLEGEE